MRLFHHVVSSSGRWKQLGVLLAPSSWPFHPSVSETQYCLPTTRQQASPAIANISTILEIKDLQVEYEFGTEECRDRGEKHDEEDEGCCSGGFWTTGERSQSKGWDVRS